MFYVVVFECRLCSFCVEMKTLLFTWKKVLFAGVGKDLFLLGYNIFLLWGVHFKV